MSKRWDSLFELARDRSFHYSVCGIFFLFYNINELNGEMEFDETLIPFVVLLTLPVSLKLLLTSITNKSIPSAIFTTTVMLTTLFYAHLFFLFTSSSAFIKNFLKEGYFILLIVFFIAGIALFLFTTKRGLKTLNLYLNVLLLVYLAMEVVILTVTVGRVSEGRALMEYLDKSRVSGQGRPDVYFIVTDAYANADNLKKYWNYNNNKFINALKEKGFYYIPHSRSNYNNTGSSMASMLNNEFLTEDLNLNSTNRYIETQKKIISKIKNSRVFQEFYLKGYDIYNLSIFDILNTKPFYFDRFLYPNFNNYLLSKTLPMRIIYRYTYMDHLSVLNELERISKEKQDRPKIVYCHLLLPHHPYIYDSTGALRPSTNPSFSRSEPYLDQLKYTNKLLEKSIDTILRYNPKSFIILTSDHGYRLLKNEPDKTKESFENFVCLYFPDGDYSELYPTMTSINIFNPIFDKLHFERLRRETDTVNFFVNKAF